MICLTRQVVGRHEERMLFLVGVGVGGWIQNLRPTTEDAQLLSISPQPDLLGPRMGCREHLTCII